MSGPKKGSDPCDLPGYSYPYAESGPAPWPQWPSPPSVPSGGSGTSGTFAKAAYNRNRMRELENQQRVERKQWYDTIETLQRQHTMKEHAAQLRVQQAEEKYNMVLNAAKSRFDRMQKTIDDLKRQLEQAQQQLSPKLPTTTEVPSSTAAVSPSSTNSPSLATQPTNTHKQQRHSDSRSD